MAEYLYTIICGAVLTGIVGSLIPAKSGTASLIRFVSGLCLTVLIIQPAAGMDFNVFHEYIQFASQELETPAEEGQKIAKQATNEIIKQNIETYIMDKARELGADVIVEVVLHDDTLFEPVSVTMKGAISPYAKRKLEEIMISELGILKENQRWIGSG